jgi:hypothetical protein
VLLLNSKFTDVILLTGFKINFKTWMMILIAMLKKVWVYSSSILVYSIYSQIDAIIYQKLEINKFVKSLMPMFTC